jgi:hypothetical protein
MGTSTVPRAAAPTIEAGSAGAEVLQLVGTPWHVTKAEIYAGDAASMELFPSEDDPIGQLLPCNAVLGAFILRGDMSTRSDEWVLIKDLTGPDGSAEPS